MQTIQTSRSYYFLLTSSFRWVAGAYLMTSPLIKPNSMHQMVGTLGGVGFQGFQHRHDHLTSTRSSNIYYRCNLSGPDPTINGHGFPSTSVFWLPCRQHNGGIRLVNCDLFEVHRSSDEIGNYHSWPQSTLLFKFTPPRFDTSYTDWRAIVKTASRSDSGITSSSWCPSCRNEWRSPGSSIA